MLFALSVADSNMVATLSYFAFLFLITLDLPCLLLQEVHRTCYVKLRGVQDWLTSRLMCLIR